jgi:hypothetical protein
MPVGIALGGDELGFPVYAQRLERHGAVIARIMSRAARVAQAASRTDLTRSRGLAAAGLLISLSSSSRRHNRARRSLCSSPRAAAAAVAGS